MTASATITTMNRPAAPWWAWRTARPAGSGPSPRVAPAILVGSAPTIMCGGILTPGSLGMCRVITGSPQVVRRHGPVPVAPVGKGGAATLGVTPSAGRSMRLRRRNNSRWCRVAARWFSRRTSAGVGRRRWGGGRQGAGDRSGVDEGDELGVAAVEVGELLEAASQSAVRVEVEGRGRRSWVQCARPARWWIAVNVAPRRRGRNLLPSKAHRVNHADHPSTPSMCASWRSCQADGRLSNVASPTPGRPQPVAVPSPGEAPETLASSAATGPWSTGRWPRPHRVRRGVRRAPRGNTQERMEERILAPARGGGHVVSGESDFLLEVVWDLRDYDRFTRRAPGHLARG